MQQKNNFMSKTRKTYFLRLAGRLIVFIFACLMYVINREEFIIADSWNFFGRFSFLHILWAIWMWDMLLQLMPVKAYISIGSQKIFASLFRPVKEKIDYSNLKKHIKETTASAYIVMVIWVLLTVIMSILHLKEIIDAGLMILIATFFYVCDLICVLIWCPFRLIMKNKCCTTCRIFNWDHLMMFLPIVAVNSFYSWSLVVLSFIIWIIWEICVIVYPERFWEKSNMSLKCSECTDKLCTQYCRKLRK